MRLVLFAATLFLASPGYGQQLSYHPFKKNIVKEKEIAAAITARLQQDVLNIRSNYKKEVAAIYKERADAIKERVEASELITDSAVTNYLDGLAKQIISGNSTLAHHNLRIYFSRTPWPNASSMGEGTIVFNVGLFSRLDNEAQVAFILCHELAHYLLNHGNNSIARYVETVNSTTFQTQLKEISKAEFSANKQLEQLALKIGFNSRRHSRAFEKEADSMALVLLKNTNYDLREASSCLALLDSIDKDKHAGKQALENQFNFAEYPFKKRWIENKTLSFTDNEKEKKEAKALADSLKTHPDCQLRIAYVEKELLQGKKNNTRKFQDQKKFETLQKLFEYEGLEYLFETDKISRCLFTCLQMLNAGDTHPYVLGLAGKCLTKIYTAQQQHSLSKIVSLPSPDFDEEYNNFLKLLQNVRLTELASIAYHFLQTHSTAGKSSEDFVAALIASKENAGKPEEKKEWINYYNSNFSNPKYKF